MYLVVRNLPQLHVHKAVFSSLYSLYFVASGASAAAEGPRSQVPACFIFSPQALVKGSSQIRYCGRAIKMEGKIPLSSRQRTQISVIGFTIVPFIWTLLDQTLSIVSFRRARNWRHTEVKCQKEPGPDAKALHPRGTQCWYGAEVR